MKNKQLQKFFNLWLKNFSKVNLIKKSATLCVALFLLFALIISLNVTAQENSNNKITNMEGTLEVFHFDDFANPANSRNLFYLKVGDKRYRLVSDKQIPLIISGTSVRVSGEISDNKILLESMKLKGSEEEILQPTRVVEVQPTKEEARIGSVQDILQARLQAREEAKKETLSRFNWVYIAIPIILVFAFLVYVELKRKKEHTELMQKFKQQNTLSLRNYVMTSLRRGYKKEQIKNALSKTGYSTQEIEEAFRGLR